MTFIISLLICFNTFISPKELRIQANPGGIYQLPSQISNTRIVVIGSGTKSSPFLLKGSKGFTQLMGNSSVTIVGDNINISDLEFINNDIEIKYEALIKVGTIQKFSNNINITNCKFSYTKGFIDKDMKTSFFWIRLSANNSKITNCIFSGKKNRMPIVHIEGKSINNEISNCTFRDVNKRVNDLEALEAIRVGLGEGSAGVLIQNNKFLNYFGDSETISIKADGVKIDKNYFENCRSGISLRMSDFSIITHNIFHSTFWPVRITGVGHVVRNNFFNESCPNTLVFIKESKAYRPTRNILIEDNIFENKVTFVLLEPKNSFGFPSDIKISNNLIKGRRESHVPNNSIGKDFFKKPNSKKRRSDGVSEMRYQY